MDCEELVALIVTNLGRRDLARCCGISKLWNQCCRWQLAHGRGLGFLIAVDSARSRLWMCDSNTGEQQWVTLGLSGGRVLAVCEGLVLLGTGDLLAIGEPSVKRWKLLRRPLRVAKSAWLGRVEGQLLILVIDFYGDVLKYDAATDSWVPFCRGPSRKFLEPVGFSVRGSCYRLFQTFDMYKLDLRRGSWDKMQLSRGLAHASDYWWMRTKIVEWRDKTVMHTLVYVPQMENAGPERAMHELVAEEGELVELPAWRDAANNLDPSWCDLVCDDYDFFWLTKKGDVLKQSTVSPSLTQLAQGSTGVELDHGALFYIPDGGEALSRSILSHLPDVLLRISEQNRA